MYKRQEQITEGNTACFQPAFSPDGKEIAYLANRTEIRALNLKSKKERVILPAQYNYSYSDGDQGFEWSPDGRWILTSFFEEGGWQHPDIALVSADGKGEIHNLTNSGYSDSGPSWMMNGKAIIWYTDRQGMRSHGSWGAQNDVYALFLDPEAYENFRMTKEERGLAQEMKSREKKQEKEAKEDDSKKDKKGKKGKEESSKKADQAKKSDAKSLPELKIDLKNIEDRMVRMTINSSSLSGAVLTPDGSKLFYLAAFEGGHDLWVHDFDNNSTRLVSKTGRRGALVLSKDGKTLYLPVSYTHLTLPTTSRV